MRVGNKAKVIGPPGTPRVGMIGVVTEVLPPEMKPYAYELHVGPCRLVFKEEELMPAVLVHNRTKTNEVIEYVGITPEEAVVAAHAQSLRDHNTWDYKDRYSHLVFKGQRTVSCGDFAALL